MIAQDWVQPVDTIHQLFKASSDIEDASGNVPVTAYPIERPDGSWAVLFVNRDRDHDHAVKVDFANADTKRDSFFSGPVAQTTLGQAQYEWHPGGEMGDADPDGPPFKSNVNGGADTYTSYRRHPLQCCTEMSPLGVKNSALRCLRERDGYSR
jgi:hypothetical protein